MTSNGCLCHRIGTVEFGTRQKLEQCVCLPGPLLLLTSFSGQGEMNINIKIVHNVISSHITIIVTIEPGDLIYVNMLVSRLESD